jgi:hypothetical protein
MAYKSKAAWEAAIARFKKRGMSLEDIRKRVGFFEEGDKKFTVHSRSNEQGYEIIDRNQRNRRDKTRSEGIRASTPIETDYAAGVKKVKQINQQGLEADHTIPQARTQAGLKEVQSKKGLSGVAGYHASFAEADVPIGHDPKNIRPATKAQNLQYEQEYSALDSLIKRAKGSQSGFSVFVPTVAAQYILKSMNQLSPLNQQSAAYGGIESQSNEYVQGMTGVSPMQLPLAD